MNQKDAKLDPVETANRAHKRAGSTDLGDIRINVLVRVNDRIWMDWLNRQLADYDLHHVSYIAMMMLYSCSGYSTSPSELAAVTGETRANVTRVCDELVARGLMKRNQSIEDRRRVDLTLTDEAATLLGTIVPQLRSRVQKALVSFSAEEKDTLVALLSKLRQSIEQAP